MHIRDQRNSITFMDLFASCISSGLRNIIPLFFGVVLDGGSGRVQSLSLLNICNTPDVTFHICNSNSCHFRLCVMIFPPWLGFVFRFAFCSCHASHIMSSCALHLHTCSSHASEHFPRCSFCNPALPPPPVPPSCFYFVSGC